MSDPPAAPRGRSVVWRLKRLAIIVITMIAALAITAMVATRVTRNGIDRRSQRTFPAYVALVGVDHELDRLQRVVRDSDAALDDAEVDDVLSEVGAVFDARDEALQAGVGGAAADQLAELTVLLDGLESALRDEGSLPDDAQAVLDRAHEASGEALDTAAQELRADMLRSRLLNRRFLAAQLVIAAVTIGVVAWQLRATARGIASPLAVLRGRIDRARRDEIAAAASPVSVAEPAVADPAELGDILEVIDLAEDFDRLTSEQAAWRRREREVAERRQLLLDIAAVTRQGSGRPDDLARVCEMLAAHLRADRCGLLASIEGRTWASWWQAPEEDRAVIDWLAERLLPEPVDSLRFLLDGPTSITDLAAHPAAAANDFDAVALGLRSMLTAPLMLGNSTVGVLGVTMDHAPREWTEDDAALVRLAADLVAQAVAERQYVESLRELDRQKSDFLANASHELRTPLTSIAGYLEMLRDGDYGPVSPEQEQVHQVIERNTARLRDMIEDVLVLSRIEGDRLRPSQRRVDVNEIVERVRGDLDPVARRKGVALSATAGDQPIDVVGDREQLERALTNVVANAVKFTRPGGEVVVGLAVGDGEVIISCRDTGIGIPAEDLAMTGTKFFRARNAAEHVIPGTGIGLTIVRSIIEAHGGRMVISSVEGEGTTVELTIPVAPSPSE